MKKHRKLLYTVAQQYADKHVSPSCQHAGECGGCLLQHITYNAQLLIKKDYCNKVLEGIVSIEEVIPSRPLGYRNRMDYVTAFGRMGLRKRGNWRHVVDLEDCLLLQNSSRALFATIRQKLAGIEDYDYHTHRGYLRYIVLREGFNTGQVMVNFVIARHENNCKAIIDAIADRVTSMSLVLNDGLTDLSYGRVIEDIKQGYIEEKLNGICYRITPNSFFQANTHVTQMMYTEIAKHVYGRALDIYCGVGSISLFIANNVETVTGVECNPEAVMIAKENALINAVPNAVFIESDAMNYFSTHSDKFDVVVVDPPRTGLEQKVVQKLMDIHAKRIVYMSCNPVTFADDAGAIMQQYTLQFCKAYDMFPQTQHVELLAIFDRT